MSWFPEGQNIPKICNMQSFHDAINVLQVFSDKNFCPKIKAEDLTFIIPFSSDSKTRNQNLFLCLQWIFLNTSAKVHLFFSEKKNSFNEANWVNNQNSKEARAVFEKYSSNNSTFDLSNLDLDSFVSSLLDATFLSFFSLKRDNQFSDLSSLLSGKEKTDKLFTVDWEHLKKYFKSRIRISFEIRENEKPFHRTKYLNQMLSQVETKLVCNHDADVILPIRSIENSLSYLRNFNNCSFVYPYGHSMNGNYQICIPEFDEVRKLTQVCILNGDFINLLSSNSTFQRNAAYGHSIFAKTESYKSLGGENEEFISWGPEDVERYVRFIKSGLGVVRLTDGYVFHLEHPRGSDSGSKNPHFLENEKKWELIQKLDQKELFEYYSKLDYVKKYEWEIGGIL